MVASAAGAAAATMEGVVDVTLLLETVAFLLSSGAADVSLSLLSVVTMGADVVEIVAAVSGATGTADASGCLLDEASVAVLLVAGTVVDVTEATVVELVIKLVSFPFGFAICNYSNDVGDVGDVGMNRQTNKQMSCQNTVLVG